MTRTMRTVLWCIPAFIFVAFMAALAGHPLPYLTFAALGLLP